MPNHVSNKISGPALEQIRALLKSDESEVDFDCIIPQPKGLRIEPHMGVVDAARFALKEFPDPNADGLQGMSARLQLSNMLRGTGLLQGEKRNEASMPVNFNEKDWEDFIQCLKNRREHGHYTWYDWCIENWGTKWNAYEIKSEEDYLYFETAWSFPEPIMKALVEKLPKDAEFTWEYADEDFGNNLGIWEYKNGELTFSEPDGDHREYAMRLHGWDDEEIEEHRKEVEDDE